MIGAVGARAPPIRLPLLRSYTAAMLAAVLVITGLRLLWLALQPGDLYPDEAQYWVWSRHLALGYYSKPPLVAWLIALTTAIFGEGEFVIRLSAPLLHAGTAIFVYGIGARLYDHRVGFWSALAYASLPGVSVSAFIISTDAALLLFWAAALCRRCWRRLASACCCTLPTFGGIGTTDLSAISTPGTMRRWTSPSFTLVSSPNSSARSSQCSVRFSSPA